MKIGIIVYSQIGNTSSVASSLYDKLKKEKYDVSLEKIEALRDMKKNNRNFKIINAPDLDKYDFLILASYVEGFMLCPVMKEYLKNISSKKNKRALAFLTHLFPFHWMGANHAMKEMISFSKKKEIIVQKTEIIDWSNKKRGKEIEILIDEFSNHLRKVVD